MSSLGPESPFSATSPILAFLAQIIKHNIHYRTLLFVLANAGEHSHKNSNVR
jgi:hypothetical protein